MSPMILARGEPDDARGVVELREAGGHVSWPDARAVNPMTLARRVVELREAGGHVAHGGGRVARARCSAVIELREPADMSPRRPR